jgi:hypothetical protein
MDAQGTRRGPPGVSLGSERQRALDCSLVRAGRAEEYIFDMLERLEGRSRPAVDVAPPAVAVATA